MRFLSHEEEARLIAALYPSGPYKGKCKKVDIAKQGHVDLVVCLLQTGARYSEIAHMTWDQVDFANKTVFIKRKKGGTDTLLAMSAKLYEVLTRRKAESTTPHIFPKMLCNSNCFVWLDRALKAAGISSEGGKITIHHLRHTYASRMLNAGLSIVEVQLT
jgi:integrase